MLPQIPASNGSFNILSVLFSKLIDPIVAIVLNIIFLVITALVLFLIYIIIRLRINPFNLTPSKINGLKRMNIKLKIVDFVRWLIVDLIYLKKNRSKFNQYGLTFYCGRQGAGKIISMIDYANKVHERFPDCIIVSNFDYKYANYRMQDWRDLMEIRNGTKGVLFLIDEIHSEYSSQAWKDFPESLLSEISQQRKQRVKICATAQVYSRVVKQLREQAFTVVQCCTVLSRWTFCKEYDARDYEIYCDNPQQKKLKPYGKRSFVQNDKIRRCYDTYEKIIRMKKISEKGGFIPRNERPE